MRRKLKSWIVELRAPFLTATLVSILLGTAIAWTRNGIFSLEYFLLALLGGAFLHLGTNVANDYFDYKSGNDEVNKEFVRPFSGGSRAIQLDLLTPREVLSGALVFYTLATMIGLYLTWIRGPFVILLGLIGLLSGFFYTAPPLNWAGKGIGEALVGMNFGALMTLGAYYVQTQELVLEPLVASVPVSLLIAAVLYINEFPDYVADRNVGKKTLVVRLGRKKAAYGYAAVVFGAYVSIAFNVFLGITPQYTLFALIPLPLAVKAVRHAFKFYSESYSLAPANALTIVFHLLTSLLISFGYLSYVFESMSVGFLFISVFSGACTFFTVYFYLKVKTKTTANEFKI